jgi:hypothetical protein
MRCEREIIGENFEKRENKCETIKKKEGRKFLGEIMGEKKCGNKI